MLANNCRPERAKALKINAFSLQGDVNTLPYTQGDCPGLTASGPSVRSPYLRSVSLVFTLFHFDTSSLYFERRMMERRVET